MAAEPQIVDLSCIRNLPDASDPATVERAARAIANAGFVAERPILREVGMDSYEVVWGADVVLATRIAHEETRAFEQIEVLLVSGDDEAVAERQMKTLGGRPAGAPEDARAAATSRPAAAGPEASILAGIETQLSELRSRVGGIEEMFSQRLEDAVRSQVRDALGLGSDHSARLLDVMNGGKGPMLRLLERMFSQRVAKTKVERLSAAREARAEGRFSALHEVAEVRNSESSRSKPVLDGKALLELQHILETEGVLALR